MTDLKIVNGVVKKHVDRSKKDEKTLEPRPLTVSYWRKIFKFSYCEDGITITEYIGSEPEVVVPDYIGKRPVTELGGSGAFSNNKALTSVTLPDTLRTIGTQTFHHCKNLREINIPPNVTTIGRLAFSRCISLESIVIPEGVIKIGYNAFYCCANLSQVVLPRSVTDIDFQYYFQISSKQSLTPFNGCDKLTLSVPAGSYAEEFAKKHNVKFIAK